ncbi:hypothetical protein [Psychrobacter piscatorii]|uniref:hypothetical protein n=1 Tax=Psychrobacter piscatorii TaxID=554343 RepID=UPI003734D57E
MLEQVTLSSNGIILEPLTLAHATDLVEACQDGKLWKINVTSVPEPDKVIDYINIADSMPDRQAFAVMSVWAKRLGQRAFMTFCRLPNA